MSLKFLVLLEKNSLFFYQFQNAFEAIDFLSLYELQTRNGRKDQFWLVDVTIFGSIDIVTGALSSIDVPLNSNLFMLIFTKANEAKLWEVYRIQKGMRLIVDPFGDWVQGSGIRRNIDETISVDRRISKLKEVVAITNPGGSDTRTSLIPHKWERRRNLQVSMYNNDFDEKYKC